MIKLKTYEKSDNNIVAYLQLIQEPINRMSTLSAILKGFCATMVATIIGVDFKTIEPIILILSILLVILFAVLDIYYLSLERRFRFLYNQVRIGEHECNFDLDIIHANDAEGMQKAKATVCECIKSMSFLLFYPIMIVICIILTVLGLMG